MPLTKETYIESEHPRDDIGQWIHKNASGSASAAQPGTRGYSISPNAPGVIGEMRMPSRHPGGSSRQESIQSLPKAPPPIPSYMPLTRFEALAIEEGLANRETLPQYSRVTSGASLNAGHSKGVEIRDLRANEEILVYVRNLNVFITRVEVKAGTSFSQNETQMLTLFPMKFPRSERVLRFRNYGQLIQYLSIDSQADSFSIGYEVFSRGHYAPH